MLLRKLIKTIFFIRESILYNAKLAKYRYFAPYKLEKQLITISMRRAIEISEFHHFYTHHSEVGFCNTYERKKETPYTRRTNQSLSRVSYANYNLYHRDCGVDLNSDFWLFSC